MSEASGHRTADRPTLLRVSPRRTARLALVATLAPLLVATLALMAGNAGRLDGGLEAAVEAQVRDARGVAHRAGSGYERRALDSIGYGSLNGWFRRLDAPGLPALARGPASRPPGDERDAIVWSLEFDDARGLISFPPGAPPPRVRDGALSATATWPSTVTHVEPFAIPVDQIGEIRVAVRDATSPQLVLAWSVEEKIADRPLRVMGPTPTVAIDLVPGSVSRVYVVDARALRRRTPAGATIRRLFLSPVTAEGGRAEVDYIRVVSRLKLLTSRGVGVGYENVAGDLRRVVYAAGKRQLLYRMELPEEPVRLRFSLAALGQGAPARAGVRVEADGVRTAIFEARASPGAAWQEADIDLSRFATREVSLELWSEAAPGQVVLWANPVVQSAPTRTLNVIVYLEDTLRADHLSALGYHRDTTPVKRAFARDAVVFENAISQATKTRPSVVSLMTSLPPSATGVVRFWERLGDGYLTLAELLRHQGFTTAAMLQNGNGGAPAGLHQGFGLSLDHETVGDRPDTLVEPVLLPWLRRHADRNFFVYVHVLDPHDPYEPLAPDDEWARSLGGDDRDAQMIAGYDGEIRHADRHFGRLLQELEELGLADDTVVVYLSDHGEFLGEEGRWTHLPPGDPAVVHVPLMIRYPAGLGGGRRVALPVQLLDVVPTLLDLLGIDTRRLALSGRSLVRLARTGRDPTLEARPVISEEPSAHPVEMRGRADVTGSIFYEGWQLQRSRLRTRRPWVGWVPAFRASRWVDGATDVVMSLDPLVRHRHAALMFAWQEANLEIWRSLSGPDATAVAVDPDANERLRALGYIQRRFP